MQDLRAAHYPEHVNALRRAYERVLAEHALDGVWIYAGDAQKKSEFDDQDWPLRPTPHFQHWTPLAWPGSAILIVPGEAAKLMCVAADSFWEAAPARLADAYLAPFEVIDVQGTQKAPAVAREHAPRGRLAFVGATEATAQHWGAHVHNPPELLAALDQLRTRKSAYEQACVAEANRRAAQGHLALAEAYAAGGVSELELHLLFLRATAQDDAQTPYKNIVATGRHAATLHHVDYARERAVAPSLLVDAGATCNGYHSDITRTWVQGEGAAAQGFRELIRLVEALQQEMCRRALPGVRYEDLHDQAHELLAPALRELGLVRGSDEELVARGVTRKFFPHGLGHALGVQTHDVGCRLYDPRPENAFLRTTVTLALDHVFTIEPGCYFIDSLLDELGADSAGALVDWDGVAALRPFGGVRIEDNIVVGGEKPRNLTREGFAVAARATVPATP